ncbi:MAG: HNH endonuclease [Synergistaceae bacterium]|jgi:hypothetical protein|nr:HNH endonuclease [Synergistaceae bacterium]
MNVAIEEIAKSAIENTAPAAVENKPGKFELPGTQDASDKAATTPGLFDAQEIKDKLGDVQVNTENVSREDQSVVEDKNDIRNCPIENNGGHWDGVRGDSRWEPDRDYIPPDNGKGNNPEGKTMGQICDESKIDGITYKNGEPDFSEVRKGEAVEIEGFSDNRPKNFSKADVAYAQKHNEMNPENPITPGDVKKYREEYNLTWHERRDCKTMELVPREVHGNFSHRGGISEYKSRSEGL